MSSKFIPYKLKLRLEIGGRTIEEVTAVNATFELNGIPFATVDVAAGVNIITGQASSANDGSFDSIPLRSPARVLLDVAVNDVFDGDLSSLFGLPPGKNYVIFDGYYIGTGWVRSREQAHFRVHLIHWIDDLNCSSMVNGNYSPGMPADLAQAAVNIGWNLVADNDGGAVFSSAVVANVSPTGDMWTEILKPMFLKITSQPHFQEQRLGPTVGTKSGNDAAERALARMPGTCASARNAGMLKLNIANDVNTTGLESSFKHTLTEMLKNNMGQTSFWGKLLGEFCPEFLLAVSPAVECAQVIPFFGGLSTPWRTINANDYVNATFNCAATNLIESVNLFHSMRSDIGVTKHGEKQVGAIASTSPDFYAPFGHYPKGKDRDMRGFIMVKRPPRWLANGAPNGGIVNDTSTALRQDAHTGSLNNSTSPPKGQPTSAAAQASFNKIADNFCEHWYKTSVLAQRQGELSGKLRFDIAPGSTVKILLPDSGAIGASATRSYFAAVMSVSYVIDAERSSAGTSFALTAMRTEQENNDSKLTKSTSPLYQGGWPGGSLIRFT